MWEKRRANLLLDCRVQKASSERVQKRHNSIARIAHSELFQNFRIVGCNHYVMQPQTWKSSDEWRSENILGF